MRTIRRLECVLLAAATLLALLVTAGCATTPDGLDPIRNAQPEPSLSPQDVVEIQLQAFGNNTAEDEGIEIAFRFASPGNRAQTGPLPRFADMLRGPAYRVMLEHDRAEFAPLETRDDLAIQRVLLYTDDEVTVFDFVLRRQIDEPYSNCWMTEAVFLRGTGPADDADATVL